MEIPLIIITIVAFFYFHSTIKKTVGYIDTKADVLKPMAELQNKQILKELQSELDALDKTSDKES